MKVIVFQFLVTLFVADLFDNCTPSLHLHAI